MKNLYRKIAINTKYGNIVNRIIPLIKGNCHKEYCKALSRLYIKFELKTFFVISHKYRDNKVKFGQNQIKVIELELLL